MLKLTDLPKDILLLVCLRLDPRDLLALIQACRVLHALGTTDYVWHHIYQDLPLDLAQFPESALTSLSGSEVKRALVKALKLDDNWRRKGSRIKRLIKINSKGTIICFQPLASEWLVTLSRVPNSTIHISVWRLDLAKSDSGFASSSCIASFEAPHAFTFSAALQEGGSSAIICVLGATQTDKGKLLTAYQLRLKGRGDLRDSCKGASSVDVWKLTTDGVFYYSQINGPVIAAAIVHTDQPNTTHEIALFNTKTNAKIILDAPELQNFDCGQMQFKMFDKYMIVVGVHNELLRVYVRELPDIIFSAGFVSSTRKQELEDVPKYGWSSSISDHTTRRIRNLEIYITPESIYRQSLEFFSVMAFYSTSSTNEKGQVTLYRFPIDTSKRDLKYEGCEPAHTFTTPPNVTLEPTCLGKTGYRAVWLEHQWNSDDYRLMKASLGAAAPLIGPLQPQSLPLPFGQHTCQSLSFEESTGRVWVGVHTGEIYILDFQH